MAMGGGEPLGPVVWRDFSRPVRVRATADALSEERRRLREAEERAQRIESNAQEEADRLVQEAQALAQDIRVRAETEGHAEGVRLGREAILKERDALLNQARSLLDQAAEQRRALMESVLPDITSLVLTICRQVLGRELDASPEEVIGLAERLLARRQVTVVRANPDDVGLLEGWAAGLHRPPQIQPDASVDPHGLVLETADGVVDATLAGRMRRAVEILREQDAMDAAAQGADERAQ